MTPLITRGKNLAGKHPLATPQVEHMTRAIKRDLAAMTDLLNRAEASIPRIRDEVELLAILLDIASRRLGIDNPDELTAEDLKRYAPIDPDDLPFDAA